ncbi:MAG: 3-phosphoglycerate dehydrogenase [Ignavibacteriaceae bacterium]|nr:MAG: phosphoglycerate dehydrogenase [Chlorobiota bacterium]GJQ32086.1 MAG: 3-phosphoglycerate dehydrogenase [Ignavibacteriaceae bacterium]
MSLKVLIADQFPEKYINKLTEQGIEVSYQPKLGESDIPAAAKDVDIIVVRSTKVSEEAINAADKLNLIIRAGAGVNNINTSAANKKGVYVANCPGKNSIAVAELAVGLMVAIDRKIPDNVADFRNGVWNKGVYSKAQGIFGKNLGIIGFGNIGKEVAARATAFGMNVYAKDISRVEGYGVKEFSEMEKILPILDIITIHLPLTDGTRKLFNRDMFKLMKPNSILINTSRAEVIDEDALLEAIEEKNIFCGLDVFVGEPEGKAGEVSSKLMNNKNIYVTHHIGASTEQAQDAVAEETVNIIKGYINSGVIAHWVNKARWEESHYQLVVKHYDKPGVIASILNVMKKDNVNIEEVENEIFAGGLVAKCTIKLKQPLSHDTLEEIRNIPEIINLSHVEV